MIAVLKDEANQATAKLDDNKNQSRTDWARLKTMTDSDIEKALRDDPDSAPLETEAGLKKYKLTPPRIKTDAN
ncbi:MAG: hypothetical protein NTV43_03675 [Methylococcales bacterium]|nr:hypothetical protein [Methylococcales bacterium]